MKAAKFIICCLLTAIICIAFRPSEYASAEISSASRYAYASARDAYFYRSDDYSAGGVFIIPYRYCVLVLDEKGDWYRVKYAEETTYYTPQYGYCLKSQFTLLDAPPETLFLNMPVTVTVKASLPDDGLPVLSDTITVPFYGEYISGGITYSCVLYKDEFRYVSERFSYIPNTIPEPDPPPAEEGGSSSGSNKVIIAIALTAIAAAALLILYFTGKNKYFRPDR